MRIPWFTNRETRQDGGYTEALESLIIAQAGGDTTATPDKLAAREIALGLWGRAFASAEVSPAGPVADGIGAAVKVNIARQLLSCGEAVYQFSVEDGALVLSPCSEWKVTGGPDPASWIYEIERRGPSTTLKTTGIRSDSVLHFRYSSDPGEPWKGSGPLQRATTSTRLAANVEGRLAEELGQAAGQIMATPDGKSKEQLQSDLRLINGRLALVESTASGWGDGTQGAPRRDLEQTRIGASPPDVLAVLRSDAALLVLALMGVPVTLLQRADGTALRESWRGFLHSSVQPVADLVAEELSAKLDKPVSLSFDRLFASDLSGRARAFQSMVNGGLSTDKAAGLAGLMDAGA